MILAKSFKSGVSLIEHTQAVVDAARCLFGSQKHPTRLFECWSRFFRLEDIRSFHSTLYAAAAFHDIGKANSGFDRAVRRKGEQVIRHEHLSGLILCLPEMRSKIECNASIDFEVLLSAVISHHLKVKEETFGVRLVGDSLIKLLVDDSEFSELLQRIAQTCGVDALPDVPKWWNFEGTDGVRVPEVRDGALDVLIDMEDWTCEPAFSARHRLLQAVRSALIAADAVGSAKPRVGYTVEAFISKCFGQGELLDCQAIFGAVIDKRIEALKSSGDDFRWNDFQRECDKLPSRSLLLAPCGSGKTLAAWRWIAQQCGNRSVSRVIFLYPTRATATEGFRDYVSWAPEADAALMHGTAEFDLDGMFANPAEVDERSGKRFGVDDRLFALGFWNKRIFSATADQFLAFMEHSYAATCVLPLLADSVVVVDEAHSFDESMFSSLKHFLQNFNVPVLCMTATLTQPRIEVLRSAGLEVKADHPEALKEIADAPRYSVRLVADVTTAEAEVGQALADGKRVLWVVNQVRRAQQIVSDLRDDRHPNELRLDQDTLLYCYHSRFRLMDRRERHREVVAAVHPNCPPAVAVTTQVCEMSLDLDADVIVSEFAPVISLIQRMGRCNRNRQPRSDAGMAIFYPTDRSRPYDDPDIRLAKEFLESLTGDRQSQSDLEAALRQIDVPPDLPRSSGFLTSAPYAMAQDYAFRDIDEFTVPAILDTDIAAFLEDKKQRAGFIVPCPKGFASREAIPREAIPASIPRFLCAIPEKFYSPLVGLSEGD